MSAPPAEPALPVAAKVPFPRTFYFANGIELFERLAHYGMYIGLALYLKNVVGFSDAWVGGLLGNFRLVGQLAPVPCGAIADRISFRRSLTVAFILYATGYAGLYSFPSKITAPFALLLVAIGGGFLKPVITGTVVRTSPPGRQTEGFAIFYRMVNSGSVVGKTLAYLVRAYVGLRYVMVNSIVASLVALALVIYGYKEPERGGGTTARFTETLAGYKKALSEVRFTVFLLIFAGFYFMAEQFYMTFPQYVTRHIDPMIDPTLKYKTPLEIVTLINPALIAIFQGAVTSYMKRYRALTTMTLGVGIAATSMLVMGVVPGLVGACLSGAIFALAEMTFSPRYFDYIASFAPEGRAGMYMGLAAVPAALGSWVGGAASGILISKYLPEKGPRAPLLVWSSYAALGLVCVTAMLIYRAVFADQETAPKTA